MLDQVGQGEAHFSINTRRTSEALASAMDGRKLSEEYALKIQRIEGGQVWLTVVKVEPKIDDETDGAAQDTESEG